MAANSALSLQWSLDNTSLNTLSVGRGLVQAITSDNIQPLALLACEKFGTTLPVCIETSLKVERLARRSHSSTANFLKVQVGYSAGDAANYLSNSDGGVRFLCLAATLYSIENRLQRAQLLGLLLKDTAQIHEALPTAMQLMDLLRALETKLAISTFANDVIGWASLSDFSLYHDGVRERENKDSVGLLGYEVVRVPVNLDIQRLVRALSDCSRIGPECVVRIRSSRAFAAWTIAFVKWLTGSPPSFNFGPLASMESTSRVSFVLQNVAGLHISVVKQIDELESLLYPEYEGGSGAPNIFFGLVDLPNRFNIKIQSMFGTSGPMQEAVSLLGGAILMILKHLPEALVSIPSHEALRHVSEANLSIPRPFPNFEQTVLIAQIALGNSLKLPETVPTLEDWKESLQRHGTQCHRCKQASQDISSSCIVHLAGVLAADLLAVCLFGVENIASLKVCLHNKGPRAKKPLVKLDFYVKSSVGISNHWGMLVQDGWLSLILDSQITWLSISPFAIVSYAVGILGLQWDHGTEDGDSVICKGHGQVVYPSIFNDKQLTEENYLRLRYAQGTVRWDAMEVDKVVSPSCSSGWTTRVVSALEKLDSSYTPSIGHEFSMNWEVELEEDKGLVLKVNWELPHGTEYSCHVLILANSVALFTPPCGHLLNNAVGSVGESFFLVNSENMTLAFGGLVDLHSRKVRYCTLFASHGCPLSQLINPSGFLTIQYNSLPQEYAVVHLDGCLQCALKACLSLKATLVIC